ncbi:ABC transporter permease [Streptococcus loxodontisalivarius]|uniref:ABC-2 type transport system permease protein n=1 Tax=Streptococcus loxodontisalivarius TaxID=1349415 RepID=A0ABS2PTU5_9STRE|nr:ABC transporter permease [Streptococcus loxodontisalivarius]MBM7643457.1 ABC-2 type transport system permease protein [Streptococcus loxodontisalivarius]
MIKELLGRRRLTFQNQCLRYLRYVLNDHFVLVLIFLLGFILYQYSQLLKNFPSQPWLLLTVVTILLIMTSFMGAVALYLEEADSLFLLPKEADLTLAIRTAFKRSFAFWGLIQVFILALVSPIYLAAGLSPILLILLAVVLLAIRAFRLRQLLAQFLKEGGLDFSSAISYEKGRRQRILKFFALFTTVKGISSSMKPRSYLNPLLKPLRLEHGQTWLHLYSRAFLRNGDYLALTLRLGLLAMLSLLFLRPIVLASLVAGLFNYLLIFQLVGLFSVYDYQLMTKLYPVSSSLKVKNFQTLMRLVFYVLSLLEICSGFFHWSALLLLVWSLVLVELYLPRKLAKLID